jgi:hypothetical protein
MQEDRMMKRTVLVVLFMGVVGGVFAQRLAVVGILPFDADGVSAGEAADLTRQVIAELGSWGTLSVLEGGEAGGAEYVIQGRLARQGNTLTLSAATVETRSGRVLNESKEQGGSVSALSIQSFCAQAVENVPFPNFLLGKWRSTITMPEGPLVCILEFRSDRSVLVEQYDTWEHRQRSALKYEGYGSGTYSYAGYARRTMTIRDSQGNSRQSPVDATVGLNLKLEETLPEQTAVSLSGVRLLFNEDKSSFEMLNAGLLCGRNYDGPSVYPAETAAFTRFTKIP